MRDLLQEATRAAAMRSAVGYLCQQLQDPTGFDIVIGQGGEFGEDACQEIVEPVDGLGRLLDLSL